MKIVKVSDIKSNPINEQIYDLSGIEELAASIDEVGLLQSITVNQSNTVISGHRRLEAIKSLGWDEVSVEVIKTRKDTEAALIAPTEDPECIFLCHKSSHCFGLFVALFTLRQM